MKQPNIILISIDTLRVDHVSSYGYHRDTTPNLDRLAEEGVRFTNAYSTAAWTPPAHASMLTGLYPSMHQAVDYKSLSPRIPTIAEVLRKNGYQTVGFVNNPAVGAFVGLERGHEAFYEIWKGVTSKNPMLRGGHYLYRKFISAIGKMDQGARKTNRLIKNWFKTLRDADKPFYMFVHHIEPHNPLNPPRPFRNYFHSQIKGDVDQQKVEKMADNPLAFFTDSLKISDAENQMLIDLYDGEIAYVDYIVGDFLNDLRDQKLLDNTLVIVTADHGEHFGEHNLYSHVSSLYEPIVHIPFIVRYPAAFQPDVTDVPVQYVDIFPTILEMLNIQPPFKAKLPGKSFLQKGSKYAIEMDRPLIAEWEGRIPEYIKDRLKASSSYAEQVARFTQKFRMIKVEQMKYILWEDGMEELYELSKDTEEKINLAKDMPNLCKAMKIQLDTILSKNANRTSTEEIAPKTDNLVTQRLKDLGYI